MRHGNVIVMYILLSLCILYGVIYRKNHAYDYKIAQTLKLDYVGLFPSTIFSSIKLR